MTPTPQEIAHAIKVLRDFADELRLILALCKAREAGRDNKAEGN